MDRYNDGTTYNSGARYPVGGFSTRKMKNVKVNVSNLTILQKQNKGADIVVKQTGNPNVPGNAAVLADFSAEQTALEEAIAAVTAIRLAAQQATAVQEAALRRWVDKLMLLASFTETATGGDPVKILTTGFEVRAGRTPPAVLGMVAGLMVRLNGAPGHSKLSWDALADAVGYLVQGSPDPITPSSWTTSVVVTTSKHVANGAAPGQKYWYRVAAFNSLGQGPWCEPASRIVM